MPLNLNPWLGWAAWVLMSACQSRPAAPSPQQLAEEKQRALARTADLQRWVSNPVSELSALDGSCVAWGDSNACNYTFKASAPLQLRDATLKRTPCADILDLAGAAEHLGMSKALSDRPTEHECWLSGELSRGDASLLVLHDTATHSYGLQEVRRLKQTPSTAK